MNKPRILGGILLVIGIILNNSTFEFNGNSFISGALVGIGFVIILFGKSILNKTN